MPAITRTIQSSWDNFRRVGTVVTDENGYGQKRITHGYHYDKTFCNGHPAPVFLFVPEPEEDEETGEILNSSEIEQAKAVNQLTAKKWMDTAEDCEKQASGAFEGVHFHWYMEGVDREEIEEISDSGGEEGTTPSAGNTQEAPPEEAYDKSGCHQDMEETYHRFIALRYSYAFSEFQARDGYIRHDLHPDDLPIEIITTDSSEMVPTLCFLVNTAKRAAGGEERQSFCTPERLVTGAFLKATESGVRRGDGRRKDETEEEGNPKQRRKKRSQKKSRKQKKTDGKQRRKQKR